jgi:hypothetical protein
VRVAPLPAGVGEVNYNKKLQTKLSLMLIHLFLSCVTKGVAVFFIPFYRKIVL